MAVDKDEKKSFSLSVPMIIVAFGVIIVAGVAGWLTFGPKPAPAPPPVLTAEAKAYLDQLKLTDVGIQAAESYVKQSLVEIVGKISNTGGRTVKLVEVNCVFHNVYGQVIHRERVAVAGRRTGPLAPGAVKPFRLAFDNIPEGWNQAMPDLVIAQIQFE